MTVDPDPTPARGEVASQVVGESAAAARGAGQPAALLDGGALRGLVGSRLDGLTSRPLLVDALVLIVGLTAAWLFRFSQDDAYISFRYARNLAEGNGLVFDLGERVEGYTNFLWTALMSIPFRRGWDPLTFAHLVGLACFAATLLAVRRLATLVLGASTAALAAVGVFLTSHTVIIYGTGGGLETQLQAALLSWSLLVALRLRGLLRPAEEVEGGDAAAAGPPPAGPATLAPRALLLCAVLSLLAGLALLTRLDSAVYLGVLLLVVLSALWSTRRRVDAPLLASLAALALPALVVLTPWLVWKTGYYGSILPNTVSAKSTPLLWAIVRAAMFLAIYFFVTFQFLLVPLVVRHRRATGTTPELRVLRVLLGVWIVYLAIVGADFMEFRFLVCVLPIAAILMATILVSLDSRKVLVFALVVLVLGSGLKWRLMPQAVFGIESATGLDQHGLGDSGWRSIGRTLGAAFPGGQDSPVTIALTPAGIVPFYSDLPTLDMLGLTDPEVLDSTPCELTKLKAGHEQIATPQFLLENDVDLVLGGIRVHEPDPDREDWPMEEVRNIFLGCDLSRENLPPEARMIEITLPDGKVVLAIQLRPSPEVDAAIAELGWRSLPIRGD